MTPDAAISSVLINRQMHYASDDQTWLNISRVQGLVYTRHSHSHPNTFLLERLQTSSTDHCRSSGHRCVFSKHRFTITKCGSLRTWCLWAVIALSSVSHLKSVGTGAVVGASSIRHTGAIVLAGCSQAGRTL